MRGGYTVDAEGDTEMAVPQPIYEVIKAPKLKSWDQEVLIKWSRDRVHYVNSIKERCAYTFESFEAIVTSIRSSIEPELLESLATYILKKDQQHVTETDLENYITARCNTLKNEYVPDIAALFKASLRMNMAMDDVEARVLKYFQDFKGIIDDNGLQGLMGACPRDDPRFRTRMKRRCSILIDNLQPAMLKTQIQRLVSLGDEACKTDDVLLFDLILSKAKLQHQFHKQTKELKDVKEPKDAAHGAKSSGGQRRDNKPAQSRQKDASPASSGQANPPPRDAKAPRTGCMHCKKSHWVKDCPDLSDAEKQSYLSRIADGKSKVKPEASKVLRTSTDTEAEGQLMIRVNDLLTVPMVVDSGADRTMVPAAVVAELNALSPDVQASEVWPPIIAHIADGQEVECIGEIQLDLQVITAAGPVNMRQVNCVVLPTSRGEILLGNETLRALGIDVNHQLELLAARPLAVEENDQFALPEFAAVDGDSVLKKLGALVDVAECGAWDQSRTDQLRALVYQFQDCFRENIGADPPARVEPLRVTLQDGAEPVRCRARKYAPLQSQFLKDYTRQLEAHGLIRRNNMAKWACPAVPVKKPGTNDFRMTIDYRPVNRLTVPIAGTMPNLSVVTAQVQGSVGFAKFDLMKGFWQMPLHPDSQEQMSFMTEDTVFTPTRVPQGSMDSAVHFQNQLQVVFRPLLNRHVLIWIDDIIVFAPDVESFLHALREFFLLVEEHNLKLSVTKSVLFMTEVLWCGRVISGQGVRHDPERLAALSTLPPPPTIAALQQFLCAVNWLRDSLVDYARVSAPLYEKLEVAMRLVGRRNKNALQAAVTWSTEEIQSFDEVRALVNGASELIFPADDAVLCLFTDASALGWAIVVTQVKQWSADLPVQAQAHQLIICKGGLFKGSEKNWSVVEKEAFPIVKACADLEYLLLRDGGFRLFCDHANLIHIFDPAAELKRHVRDKLQRWAMRLCGLPYVIEHIDGENNVWADLVSRWGQPAVPDAAINVLAVRTRRATPPSALRPLSDMNFQWPSLEEIRQVQQQYLGSVPEAEHAVVDGVVKVNELVWIPTQARELLKRIFVVAHCGSQGHRGEEPMINLLFERFSIGTLATRVQRFVRECLLCKHVKGGQLLQRPWGPTYNATRRNEGVHWDYLTMGDSYGANKYVLVVKDALSHFCELFPCASADAEAAANGLLEWYKRYGRPEVLVSDQGSHFRNQVLEILCARLKIRQDFTPVYSPWINGTVERVNRDILQVVRVLLIEYKLDTKEWPYLLPVIQANLNHTPVASLAGHAPIEVFLGLPAPSALDSIVVGPGRNAVRTGVVDAQSIREQLDVLRASLTAMHREVVDVKEKRRLLAMAKKKGQSANFEAGDYVLWSRIDKRLSNNKLLAQWIGPFQVTSANERSFTIRHLVSGSEYDVHASRLKYYADSSLNETEEIHELVAAQGMAIGVSTLRDHRFNRQLRRWELLVAWIGLQRVEDSWEPLSTLMQDVPLLVTTYSESINDEQFQAAVEAATRSD